MKIFISDLHLGDGSGSDDFHRDKLLISFLDYVQENAEELIILGDFLELWQADLDRILFIHSDVVNRILSLRNQIKVTYVIGNHDYIPFVRFAKPVYEATDQKEPGLNLCIEYRDKDIGLIAEHGHRYDIINRFKNPLKSIKWPTGRHLALLIACCERLLHPDIDQWTERAIENLDDFYREAMFIRNKVPPSTAAYVKKGGHLGEFDEAVRNHMRNGIKLVIFGHIHRHQLDIIENGIYANCGTWVDNVEPTYVACHKDRIELKEATTHNLIKEIALGFKK